MVAKIKLIKKTYTKDSIGQEIPTTTEKSVFADIKSISAQEFANAGRMGLKPAIVFIVWLKEYSDETELIYSSDHFEVYRNYMRDDGRIELYCERRVSND